MKSNEERINNIYLKVTKIKKHKSIKMKKIYTSLSIILCIIFIFIYINSQEIKGDVTDGVHIAALTIPTHSDLPITYDMKPLILYEGNIYTFSQGYKSDDKKELLLGEYLGITNGKISELTYNDLTNKENASTIDEFPSTTKGYLYSFNGYEKSFRICIYDETNSYIEVYEKLNNINLTIGKDLYGDRLHLKNNYTSVLYELHDDFMNMKNEYKEYSKLKHNEIDKFIDALYKSHFIALTNKEEIDTIPNYDNDGDKIAHMYLKMNDGTTIKLTLFKNGYVLYDDMIRIYVYIKDDIFNKVFQAITLD